ncbi:hypothetical protein E2C01_029934 [Portunus trituberculatus]|uniref:Uncharacterized protein n=1 Tax=Portunus trituberculatus TaxID=210409 RepID=A0A5B7ESV4_PORTR|nr:hypothetical protein [Portunus trituberculatus]
MQDFYQSRQAGCSLGCSSLRPGDLHVSMQQVMHEKSPHALVWHAIYKARRDLLVYYHGIVLLFLHNLYVCLPQKFTKSCSVAAADRQSRGPRVVCANTLLSCQGSIKTARD